VRIDSISNLAYTQTTANTGHAAGARQASQSRSQQIDMPPEKGLTGAERAFFAKLFPGSGSQISAHKTYSPAGMSSTVELGQIVNRKG
jgi:hypothetical protein